MTGAPLLTPPDPVVDPKDRKIRFRVEDDAGNASATWTVIGSKNADDVYVGVRSFLGHVKLSLHAETWRMAIVAGHPDALELPPDVDRVLHRYTPTPEVAPGWRRAATIWIPTSSLCPLPDGGQSPRTSTFPAPKPGWGIRFDLLLGDDPTSYSLRVEDAIGEVGRMTQPSGKAVWLVATEVRPPPEWEQFVEDLRVRGGHHPGVGDATRGWCWGWQHDDAGPDLIDLGHVARQ